MDPEDSSIAVNFSRPIPLFPLDHVTLLPQQLIQLHIFEPRYLQMVEHALATSCQLAMAVFDGDEWRSGDHPRPRLKRAVCVGHILQKRELPDERCNIVIQGVCRARIVEESRASEGRLYRQALLEPVGLSLLDPSDCGDMLDAELRDVRSRLRAYFDEGELARLNAADQLLLYITNDQIPTQAVMEIVSFTLVQCPRLRYRLLEEASTARRAEILLGELDHLSSLVRRAVRQHPESWPKGLSWN